MKKLVEDYIGLGSAGPQNRDQWQAINKYARKNGVFLTGFITLFEGGGGQNPQTLLADLQQEAYKKGVVVMVASILKSFNRAAG